MGTQDKNIQHGNHIFWRFHSTEKKSGTLCKTEATCHFLFTQDIFIVVRLRCNKGLSKSVPMMPWLSFYILQVILKKHNPLIKTNFCHHNTTDRSDESKLTLTWSILLLLNINNCIDSDSKNLNKTKNSESCSCTTTGNVSWAKQQTFAKQALTFVFQSCNAVLYIVFNG